MRFLLWPAAVLFFAAPAAHAQPDPGAADPEAAVRAVVSSLFDAMRANDSTGVRAVMHPEARLLTVAQRNGQHRLIETDIDAFVRAVGTSAVSFDERVDEVEVRVDDGLATAWMAYRFYAGEQFSHCGVNAMHLALDEAGWRLVHIMDTRRTGCE
jgi:uncharacterized protein (TIGR02246 family)